MYGQGEKMKPDNGQAEATYWQALGRNSHQRARFPHVLGASTLRPLKPPSKSSVFYLLRLYHYRSILGHIVNASSPARPTPSQYSLLLGSTPPEFSWNGEIWIKLNEGGSLSWQRVRREKNGRAFQKIERVYFHKFGRRLRFGFKSWHESKKKKK